MSANVPHRPTIVSSLGNAFRRTRSVEKRRIWPSEWHCVRPVAPAAPWTLGTIYYVGDVVSRAGNGYRCVNYHVAAGGNTPPNVTYWEVITDDPYSVPFAGAWLNIGGNLDPSAYRFNQGDVDVRVNATGDEDTADSLIFTITAAQFIPVQTKRVIGTMGASGEFQAEIDLMGSESASPGQVIFRSIISGVEWEDAGVDDNLRRVMQVKVFTDDMVVVSGDGQLIFVIPTDLNGLNLVEVAAYVSTPSVAGTISVQVRNVTGAADMLSTPITIDPLEVTSYTSAVQPVISLPLVHTADLISVDVDAGGIEAQGLGVVFSFA